MVHLLTVQAQACAFLFWRRNASMVTVVSAFIVFVFVIFDGMSSSRLVGVVVAVLWFMATLTGRRIKLYGIK